MIFTENYLHEIPKDIQLLIIDYSKRTYYDIKVYVSTISNLNNRKKYVSKRMHKKIMKLTYSIKNVEKYSHKFIDRYKTSFFALKKHIRNIISNLKIEKIQEIFSYNYIFNSKQVYKMFYGDRDNILDYDRELLLEIILNMYKTTIELNVVY